MIHSLQGKAPTTWHDYGIVNALTIATVSVALIGAVQFSNPRTLVAWHGFLHTAIANRFSDQFHIPENPFFAGEPVAYYWFYHYVAHSIGRVFHLHPLHSFQIITLSSLFILWMSSAAIGSRYLGSVKTGLLVGFLGLAGVNPLGPVIAVAKHIVLGQELFNAPRVPAVETVFVSEQVSGTLMTQPLLGALYITADWRRGQNIAWYLDNSSRGTALALLFPLLLAYIGARPSLMRCLSVGGTAALVTAFSPLVGVAAIGSIFAATVLVAVIAFMKPGFLVPNRLRSSLFLAVAAVLGMLLTSFTYYHLFLVGSSGGTVPPFGVVIGKAIALAVNVVVLLPLAIWGCLRSTEDLKGPCWILVIAACALLFAVPLVSLADDTEHNLANTAYCLLAFPAVAWMPAKGVSRKTYACLVGLFIPTTLGTIISYLDRPPLPIAFQGAILHRMSGDPLERLYQWTRSSTPADAVFVADPSRPVKMSGNVSEFPAFTGRTLFVDEPTYLTTPYGDFARRAEMATRLSQGIAQMTSDSAYLTHMRRPVYLLSYDADQSELKSELKRLYGPPVFQEAFVAVFELVVGTRQVRDESS
jgi:hypothetical protein